MILKSAYTRNAICISKDWTEETINTVTKVFWQKHGIFLRDFVKHQKEGGGNVSILFYILLHNFVMKSLNIILVSILPLKGQTNKSSVSPASYVQ